ncbi:MAG: DUF2238 domain-containing protein [Candidatus Shapirobacteria bacterium]
MTYKLKLKLKFKGVYLLLLFYTIINSLVLAFFPNLRNLIFNRFGHLLSGIIFSILAHNILKATKTTRQLSKPLFYFFVFCFASTAGVFNEIIELILDLTARSQRLGPTPDTATDLLMNTLGISAYLLFKKNNDQKRKTN